MCRQQNANAAHEGDFNWHLLPNAGLVALLEWPVGKWKDAKHRCRQVSKFRNQRDWSQETCGPVATGRLGHLTQRRFQDRRRHGLCP